MSMQGEGRRAFTKRRQILLAPSEVQGHNKWGELQEDIMDYDDVRLDLPQKGKTHGMMIQHGLKTIKQYISGGPHTYIIGYTADPCGRWARKHYCYLNDKTRKWQKMIILLLSTNSTAAAAWEAALISHHLDKPGCKNENLGGDGEHKQPDDPYLDGIFAVYLVLRDLSPGK